MVCVLVYVEDGLLEMIYHVTGQSYPTTLQQHAPLLCLGCVCVHLISLEHRQVIERVRVSWESRPTAQSYLSLASHLLKQVCSRH